MTAREGTDGMAVEALKLIDNTACIRSGLRSPLHRVKGRTRLRFRSLELVHRAFIQKLGGWVEVDLVAFVKMATRARQNAEFDPF